MRKRKAGRIVLCLTVFTVLLSLPGRVFAVTSESQSVITPENMKAWDDGANVEKKSSGTASKYKLSVTADTKGLQEGYYSVYFYDDKPRNIKPYDGISFQLNNKKDSELKINLTFTVNSKVSVSLTDASFVVLESAGSSIGEAVASSYGTVSIPAGFNGTVYVPFSQLYTSDGEAVPLVRIQSWGITAVMPENQKIGYIMGNIAFLSGSIDSMKDSYYLITLQGEDKITIPNTGSALETYEAVIKNMEGTPVEQDAVFFMEESLEGVTLSKDGKLEVKSDCVASGITVYAKVGKSINYGKIDITLERMNSEMARTGVPRAADVSEITSPLFTELDGDMGRIRMITAAVILVFGLIFSMWFLQAKRYYKSVKKKLYKRFRVQEEEL